MQTLFSNLVDRVVTEIKSQLEAGDETALDELLKYVPVDYLIGFLDEDLWVKYEPLLRGRKMYQEPETFKE